jgi:DnaJ-class molecular chaperone
MASIHQRYRSFTCNGKGMYLVRYNRNFKMVMVQMQYPIEIDGDESPFHLYCRTCDGQG